ncbi:MAG TPA: hypothetical protein PLL50_06000 [Propionicimonas sp.]|nr:hypothetical protein [Propionicimonas sp.]HQA77891.1 hypothetical protein [Propionicimonas sp.]HQD96232.1 hypothetical protein [Propionicimonas sp.]
MEQNYYWVQAAPFRALLEQMIEATGTPWPELAGRAHVPLRLTHALLFGQNGRQLPRVPYDFARRIILLAEVMGQVPPGTAARAYAA